MDLEATKPTKARATQSRTRQFLLIATGAFLIVSSVGVCAEVAAVGNDNFASLSEAETQISAGRSARMRPLRASPELGQARWPGSVGAASAPARIATRQVTSSSRLRLRLDWTLTSLAGLNAGTRRMLPVGELNRAGIVRARMLQIRDGAFYLVGSYADHEETARIAGDDAVRD